MGVLSEHISIYYTNLTIPDTAIAHNWQPAEPSTEHVCGYKPEPAGTEYTRGLIMARVSTEDPSWIDRAGLDVQKYIYVVDEQNKELRTPMNKGNEVMAYLTFIIDHYDALPDINIFIHQHRFAKHNNLMLNRDAVQMITRLNNGRVIEKGYLNLNCEHKVGCPTLLQLPETMAQSWRVALVDFYTRLYPERLMPFEISQPCCSQFAVSRDRIRSVSLSQYISFRLWLLQTKLGNYDSGRVWEYLWHVIFTGNEVLCPTEYACYCEVYDICLQGDGELNHFRFLHNRAGQIKANIDKIDGMLDTGQSDTKGIQEKRKGLEVELAETVSHRDAIRAGAIQRGHNSKITGELSKRILRENNIW